MYITDHIQLSFHVHYRPHSLSFPVHYSTDRIQLSFRVHYRPHFCVNYKVGNRDTGTFSYWVTLSRGGPAPQSTASLTVLNTDRSTNHTQCVGHWVPG